MSSQSDWTLDYCLSCDKQTTEGLYCSQACRHADIDNVRPSSNSSIRSLSLRSTSSWSGFVLPPAFDFAGTRGKSKTACNSPVIEFKPPFDGAETKRSSVSSFAESTASTTASWQSIDYSIREATHHQQQHQSSKLHTTLSRESKEELQRYEGLFTKPRHRQAHQDHHQHRR